MHALALPGGPLAVRPGSLPPSAQRLLAVEIESTHWSATTPTGELAMRAFGHLPVQPITEAVRADAEDAARWLEANRAPAGREFVAAQLARLALHFPRRDLDEQGMQLVAADLIDELQRFPAWALAAACQSWLRTEKFWPRLSELLEKIHDEMFSWRDMTEGLGAKLKAIADADALGVTSRAEALALADARLARHVEDVVKRWRPYLVGEESPQRTAWQYEARAREIGEEQLRARLDRIRAERLTGADRACMLNHGMTQSEWDAQLPPELLDMRRRRAMMAAD